MVENQNYGVEEDDFSGISAVPQKVEMEVTSIAQAGEASQVHRDHDGENTTVLPSCASQSGVLAAAAAATGNICCSFFEGKFLQ